MTDEPANYVLKVPTDEDGRLEILSVRPPLWEYLLFGNRLYVERKAYDVQWRDYWLGYTMEIGPPVDINELGDVLKDRMSYVSAIVQNLERIVSQEAQKRAFGRPGESGDQELIEHMALRLMGLYGQLLAWSSETRALRVPPEAERLKEIAVSMASQPIRETHDFVDKYIVSLEQGIWNLANGTAERQDIKMELIYDVDNAIVEEFDRELDRVANSR